MGVAGGHGGIRSRGWRVSERWFEGDVFRVQEFHPGTANGLYADRSVARTWNWPAQASRQRSRSGGTEEE